jgi:hypothetical protein
MKNVTCLCVLLFCFCRIGLAADGAEDRDGTLHCVVTDFAGAVVPNASIKIEHWETSKGVHVLKEDSSAMTDQYGRYSIALKPGTYDVFLSFLVFSPVAKKVKIESGKPTEISPKLEIDPLARTAILER